MQHFSHEIHLNMFYHVKGNIHWVELRHSLYKSSPKIKGFKRYMQHFKCFISDNLLYLKPSIFTFLWCLSVNGNFWKLQIVGLRRWKNIRIFFIHLWNFSFLRKWMIFLKKVIDRNSCQYFFILFPFLWWKLREFTSRATKFHKNLRLFRSMVNPHWTSNGFNVIIEYSKTFEVK